MLILLMYALYFRPNGYTAFLLKMESISIALDGYQLCAQLVQGTGTTGTGKTQSLFSGSSRPSGPHSDYFKFMMVLIFLLYIIIFYV